jgi:hypothetical protein
MDCSWGKKIDLESIKLTSEDWEIGEKPSFKHRLRTMPGQKERCHLSSACVIAPPTKHSPYLRSFMISYWKVLPTFCRNLSTSHLVNWFSINHLAAVLLKGEAPCPTPS